MKLFGIILLWFQLCLSKDVPDITAIYHVGRNTNVNYVDIHLRTDAQGLGIQIGNKLTEPRDLEFHVDADNLNTWEYKNLSIITTATANSVFCTSLLHESTGFSNFHPFHEGVQVKKTASHDIRLFLTPDETPFESQTEFYYVHYYDNNNAIYLYKCSRNYRYSEITVEGKQFPCSEINNFYVVSNRYFLITQENGMLNLWFDNFDSNPRYQWESQIRINYYRLHSQDNVQIAPLAQFLVTKNESELISPSFIPKYKNLCIAAVLYIEELTVLKSMDVYIQDVLVDKVFLGSFGKDLIMHHGWYTKRFVTSWPDNMTSSKVRLVLEISVARGSLNIKRIASCNPEYKEDVIVLQKMEIVPLVPLLNDEEDVYEDDDDEDDDFFPHLNQSKRNENCWHNSMYFQGHCACAPGFVGSTCKKGCGQNRYGKDCEGKCSVHPSECSGLLLCTPLAGCFCAPGYRGKTCEEKCEYGTYGNNCTQTCGHCNDGTCNIYTGECSSCSPGYQLPLCKIKYDYTHHAPKVNITIFGEVIVTPNLNLKISNAHPLFYTIQYKKLFIRNSYQPWTSWSTYPIPRNTFPDQQIVIEGLEHGIPYIVRTVLIDADLNSYEGDDIPVANFTSLCIIPENPDYHVEVVTNQTSFTVSWKYNLETIYWCPVNKFEVSWTGGWKWIADFTEETTYTVSNLLPATSFKFKVRAVTYYGSAKFSSISEFSTKLRDVSESVQDLKVESTSSKSAIISWSPPLGFKTVPLTYTVNYKCMKQVACHKECVEHSGQHRTANASMSLEFLYPLSQYSVTVSAEGGPTSSIILGTKMTAPVEVPKPSSKQPDRTNTSITVYWNRTEVCSGFFNNYVYQIYKVGNTHLIQTGSTKNISMTFYNLQVSTDYRILVYIQTSFGEINYEKYLEINVSTSATVPDQVQNLTVYKRGRHLLGLRWASPVNSYGPIVAFTVKYGHGKSMAKTEKIKPSPCVVWPHLFCHTVTRLQADKIYTVSVSARNSEIDADGIPAEVQGLTKEKSPGPPENIHLVNTTSSSFSIQWDYPWLANGIIRTFLMSIEETEQFEDENCCQIFPISETTVTEELEHYTIEVSGLHAASTYIVSVSAKTVVFGPSQAITIHTRPPPLPIVQLPNVVLIETEESLTWESQQQHFVNNSDIYKPLIKGTILVVVSNDAEFDNTGIQSEKLNEELKKELKTVIAENFHAAAENFYVAAENFYVAAKNFYVAAEYTGESEIQLGTDEIVSSKWGELHNAALQDGITYKLAVVQITEYCGVYNLDIVWSLPFTAN